MVRSHSGAGVCRLSFLLWTSCVLVRNKIWSFKSLVILYYFMTERSKQASGNMCLKNHGISLAKLLEITDYFWRLNQGALSA